MADVIYEQRQNVFVYTNTMNKPTQRRRGYEKVKKKQIFWISSSEKMENNHPMVPPLDHFQVIGPEEMPILVWGQRKRPPSKMES